MNPGIRTDVRTEMLMTAIPILPGSRCSCGDICVPGVDRCAKCHAVPRRAEVEGRGIAEESGILAPTGRPGPPVTLVRVRLDCGVVLLAELLEDRPVAKGEQVLVESLAGPDRYCIMPNR